MKKEQRYISSVSQYLDLINSCSNNKRKIYYRGVKSIKHKMLPGVFRTENISDKSERELLKEFITDAVAYVNNIPTDDLFHWATFAQHHGLPTRFLDFTTNPLVALYFACLDSEGDAGAVCLLDYHYYRYDFLNDEHITIMGDFKITYKDSISNLIRNNGKGGFKYPIIICPYNIDVRMTAQSAYFMVWGEDTRTLEEICEYYDDMCDMGLQELGIEEPLLNSNPMDKVYIKNSLKNDILKQLDSININEKTLFPGLDGICNYLKSYSKIYYVK